MADEIEKQAADIVVEKQPSLLELATSWLDYRKAEVDKSIQRARKAMEFNSTYEPQVPLRPSYIESGGMDDSDWRVAELEYDQHEGEQQDEDERLRFEIDGLHDELLIIGSNREMVEAGDDQFIQVFSKLELDRRAKIAEAAKKAEERKRLQAELTAGREMSGASEVEELLRQITGMVNDKKVERYKRGGKGWQVDLHSRKDEYNPDFFDFDRDDHSINVRVYLPEEGGVQISINDFSNPVTPDQPTEYPTVYGESVGFTVREGKVYHWEKSKMKRVNQWGYPHYTDVGPVLPFEQSDLDRAKGLMEELAGDMRSLIPESPTV